jgi:hypothetical protein
MVLRSLRTSQTREQQLHSATNYWQRNRIIDEQ